ncbi:hypothetical protein ZWY2020_025819 [Hordeum vulgare]|nr:hypothetical protein ZWY2020_025819 [Hordeum vulgare]
MDLRVAAPASVAAAARRGALGCARPAAPRPPPVPPLGARLRRDHRSADEDTETTIPRTVVAVILGGGAGTRLFPLTKRRAKPTVPIGGAYRLIDVPMSNCINSGINKVYVLTQFNSASLNRHLSRAYNFSNGVGFGDGFVEVLAATQRPGSEGKRWFQGTADAVRQFAWLFDDAKSKDIEDVLILSGDHLYRMDYMDFVQSHRQRDAGISICCLPIDDSRASDFGLMKIDDTGRVISFSEKPRGADLKAMQVDTTLLGLPKEEAEKKPYIASMGVYIFKKEILLNLLRWRFPTANDFGSEIIPAAAREINVKVRISFNDYWEDIELLNPSSKQILPLLNSLQSSASMMLANRCSNVHLKDTVMLGADFYETDAERGDQLAEGKVPIGIGENTSIQNCIIDKNARIGKNVTIANAEGVQESDRTSEGFHIRSGITVVLKNSVIADGLVI